MCWRRGIRGGLFLVFLLESERFIQVADFSRAEATVNCRECIDYPVRHNCLLFCAKMDRVEQNQLLAVPKVGLELLQNAEYLFVRRSYVEWHPRALSRHSVEASAARQVRPVSPSGCALPVLTPRAGSPTSPRPRGHPCSPPTLASSSPARADTRPGCTTRAPRCARSAPVAARSRPGATLARSGW